MKKQNKINVQQVTRTQNKRSVTIKSSPARKASRTLTSYNNETTEAVKNQPHIKPMTHEGFKVLARIIARIEHERKKASE